MPVSQAYNQIEKYSAEGIFTGLFSLGADFCGDGAGGDALFCQSGTGWAVQQRFLLSLGRFQQRADQRLEGGHRYAAVDPDGAPADRLLHRGRRFGRRAQGDAQLPVLRRQCHFRQGGENRLEEPESARRLYLAHHGLGQNHDQLQVGAAHRQLQGCRQGGLPDGPHRAGHAVPAEYRDFAEENEDVQATENTGVLVTKLKSTDPANTLIVTSIQKMSNIKDEEDGLNAHDLRASMPSGWSLSSMSATAPPLAICFRTSKQTFPAAIFFGFSGTPIHEENQRKENTTADVSAMNCTVTALPTEFGTRTCWALIPIKC